MSTTFNSPVFQQILLTILNVIGPNLLVRREQQVEVNDPVLTRIDQLLAEVKSEKPSESKPVPKPQEEETQAPETSNLVEEELEDESAHGKAEPDNDEEKPEESHIEVSSVKVPTEQGEKVWNVVSTPPQDRPVSTACLPCTRAHLIGVVGDLEEGLRMARTRGVHDPEVIDRIDAAAKELVTLERFDLAPDKLANLDPDEKEVIKKVLPQIRDLRQKVLNEVSSVDDLEKLAAEATETYKQVRQLSASVKPISY